MGGPWSCRNLGKVINVRVSVQGKIRMLAAAKLHKNEPKRRDGSSNWEEPTMIPRFCVLEEHT